MSDQGRKTPRFWSRSLLLRLFAAALCLVVCAAVLATSTPSQPEEPPVIPITAPETPLPSQEPEETRQHRERMVEEVSAAVQPKDQRVTAAMKTVPRHVFVTGDFTELAYQDTPLPIGYGQTISAPSIVMMMTELLALQKGEKVLEIGTGSGYQAAVLAETEDVQVYTIEIVPELAAGAAERLKQAGYGAVRVKQADGYYGWKEFAPFDAIIVTAAPDHLPAPLAEQLKDGGRLVIPIGPPGGYQTLWKFVKEDGKLKAYNITGVIFVPFTGAGIEQNPGDEAPPP